MKRIIIILLLTASAVAVKAQTFVGRVVDGQQQPVAYATVSLLSVTDSAFIAGTTTGDDGKFRLEGGTGEAVIRISCIGYRTLTQRISPANKHAAGEPSALPEGSAIPLFTLEAEATALEGVEVITQKRLVKQEMDRIAYDVEADEESKTATVMDLLRKVPLVSVDGDDNIKVKGSSSFRVYKNGHPDPSLSANAKQVLRAMPASAVKRIEVITEPGAREDAEGVNAILNIVMADTKSMAGMTGTVGASTSTNEQNNLNAYLTVQKGGLTTSLSYGYQYMGSRANDNRFMGEDYYKATGNTLFHRSHGTNPGYLHWADISASYEIDTLNLLSLSLSGYFYGLDLRGDGTTTLRDADGNLLYSMDNRYRSDDYLSHTWNGRFDYEHRTHRKNEVLTLSYMLSLTRHEDTQQHTFTNLVNVPFGYDSYQSASREHFTEHTFQIDYVRPLAQDHKIEIGSKYIYRDNNSRNTMDYYLGNVPLAELSPSGETEGGSLRRRFAHSTHVGAGYLDYLYSHGKWSARAGVRYEWSRMTGRYPSGEGEKFHTDLHDWVPQLSVKYQISDAQSLKAGFSTSISRPGIGYLNPAVVVTPNTKSFGNAHLKSARAYSASLNYMLITPKLTLTANPFYAWSDHQIVPIAYAEGDIRVSTYANEGINRRLAMNLYVQWKPWKKTTFMANITPQSVWRENDNLGLRNHCYNVDYWMSVRQELMWKLKLQASVFGMTGHDPDDVYGYDEDYCRPFFSLQRSFLKDDRLTVRLGAFAPFERHTTFTDRNVRGDITGYNRYIRNGQNFSVSVSFRFGKLNAQVKKTSVSIENNDQVGGIKKQ